MSTQILASARGTTVRSRSLTRVLRLDAVASGGLGVVLLAAGWAIDEPLGLPTALTAAAGAFLVLWTAALLVISRKPELNRTAVTEVVLVNAAWVVASVGAVFLLELTGLGIAFTLAQAAVVAGFAELQTSALRKG